MKKKLVIGNEVDEMCYKLTNYIIDKNKILKGRWDWMWKNNTSGITEDEIIPLEIFWKIHNEGNW